MPSPGRLLSVNAGRARPVPWGSLRRSAIDKQPVEGSTRVATLGLEPDEQADRAHHGGADQAVYAYAREDQDLWASRIGRDVRPGSFGENLTTEGVDVTGAVIGSRWRVGSVLLEVSVPRIPCAVFAGFTGEEHWVKRFTQEGRPGAYLRVLEEGALAPGDAVAVVHTPGHGVTLGETFRALTGERSLMPRLLEAPELPDEAHQRARRALARDRTARPGG